MVQKENDGVEGGDNDVVFIPQMALDGSKDEFSILICHIQFPVCLALAMTINKFQEQSVKYVGLDLHISVLLNNFMWHSPSELILTVSKSFFPQNKRIILRLEVVFTEVLRGLID